MQSKLMSKRFLVMIQTKIDYDLVKSLSRNSIASKRGSVAFRHPFRHSPLESGDIMDAMRHAKSNLWMWDDGIDRKDVFIGTNGRCTTLSGRAEGIVRLG